MRLNALAGNSRLKEQLSRQWEGRGLSHAYILSGPTGSGRHTLAKIVTAAFLCTGQKENSPCGMCVSCKKVQSGIHPDVTVFSGPAPGKPITVDQIRALRSDAYIRPNEGARKVYILENVQAMNTSAQNAMLKLLEEGPGYAVFLLLTDNAAALLQTIRSRCEELALSPVSPTECAAWLAERFPDLPKAQIQQVAQDCQGILGRAAAQLGGEDPGALDRQAGELARTMLTGSECALFEQTLLLEKMPKEDLPALFDRTAAALVEQMKDGCDLSRAQTGIELLHQLRQASQLNANPGQLAGWLCAGMF